MENRMISVKKLFGGVCSGLVFSAVLLFVSALILYSSSIPGSTAGVFVIVATVAGLLCAGIVSAAGASAGGWLCGGLSGILYTAILCIVSGFVCGMPPVLRIIVTLIVGFVASAVGGIIGINIKFRKKKK